MAPLRLLPTITRRLLGAALAGCTALAVGSAAGPAAGQTYPVYVSSQLDTLDYPSDVEIQGSLAYVCEEVGKFGETRPDGLRIIDLSEPGAPLEIGRYEGGRPCSDVDVAGALAVLSLPNSVRLVDVSDPTLPEPMGLALTPNTGNHGRVRLEGQYVYAVGVKTTYDAQGGVNNEVWLRIFDVSNPLAPVQVGSLDLPGYGYQESLEVAGGHLYLTASLSQLQLVVVNISDPTRPEVVGGLAGVGGEIEVQGNLAVVGGSVLDVSQPSSPMLLSSLPLVGSSIELGSGVAFVAFQSTTNRPALAVVDLHDPLEPFEIGRLLLGTSGWPTGIAASADGSYAVVTTSAGSLFVRGLDADAPACSDGLDNDSVLGDGAVDGADLECTSPADRSEEPDCADGLDNDGDGTTDAADVGCFYSVDLTEGFDCSDGVDNDGDGTTDAADVYCTNPDEPREAPLETFQVAGVVTGVTDYSHICRFVDRSRCYDDIAFGDPYSLLFTLDYSVRDTLPAAHSGSYPGAIRDVSFSLGSSYARDLLGPLQADVRNDSQSCSRFGCGPYVDSFYITYPTYYTNRPLVLTASGPPFSGLLPSALTSDALPEPEVLAGLQRFDAEGATASFWPDFDVNVSVEVTSITPLSVPWCADGIDNDADGLIDYPDDPGCTSASDAGEVNFVPQFHTFWGCGIGPELLLLVPLLAAARRRMR